MDRPQAGALKFMGHEQREFTPPNAAINQTIPVEYAYNPERQAGAVIEAQRNGMLCSQQIVLKRIEEKDEAGQKWYVLQPSGTVLFSGDCDEDVIQNLSGLKTP